MILDLAVFSMRLQAYAFCVFLSIILIITIGNYLSMPLLTKRGVLRSGKLSILVPARNEERNIRKCVTSLLSQDHPNYEVVVIDDSSTDGTAAILGELSALYLRLRVLKGTPLPTGWTGKNWACHQLANAAEGDMLLFTDADTVHAPESASSAAMALQESEAGLISGMVRQSMLTAGELITVPIMNWAMMCFMPLPLAHSLPFPSLSAACGQFMAFDSKAYFACGGHEAIKGKVLDDAELARQMKGTGRKALLYDATGLVACRMYCSFNEAVAGFSKNLFAVVRNNVPIYLFLWTWLLLSMGMPALFLVLGGATVSRELLLPACLSVLISFLIWAVAFAKSKVTIWLAAFYPILMPIWFWLAVRSMVLVILKRTSWKGRPL